MELLSSASGILLALVGLGFVIFIHELGHFLVAKWAGVRVDTFSIGFGPIIWSKTIGETEFALSLLPFGGYVAPREKADGSGRTVEEVAPAWRAAYLSAGVAFNAISSFIILLCLAWFGMPMIPPVVGDVASHQVDQDRQVVESAAQRLGLRTGDRILVYNGREPRGLEDLIGYVIERPDEPIALEIERDGERIALPRSDQREVAPVYSRHQGRATLGIVPATSRRITAVSGGDGLAEELVGWQVVSVAGEPVDSLVGQQVEERLNRHIGEPVALGLADGDQRREVTITYAGSSAAELTASAVGFPVRIRSLVAGLPAEQAGIAIGDGLVAVDGEPVVTSSHFSALVQAREQRPFELHWKHLENGSWVDRRATLETRLHEVSGRQLIGVGMETTTSGVLPVLPPALGGQPSPLAAAGIEPGDALVSIEPVAEATGGRELRVRYLRGGEPRVVTVGEPARSAMLRPDNPPLWAKFFVDPKAPIAQRLIGKRVLEWAGAELGVSVLQLEDPVVEEGPDRFETVDLASLPDDEAQALSAQLEPGDWIVAGHPVEKGTGLGFQVIRGAPGDALRTTTVRPAEVGVAVAFRQRAEPPYHLQSWTEAFGLAGETSWGMLTLTFRIIPKFFRSADEGGVDATKSLAGPIGIFSELKARADLGFASFLKILALLGLNLVIVNLLPIPIADGGRLLMLAIEVVTRRPVPERVEMAVNMLGFIFIVALMLFVVGVDILREMGRH